YTDGTRVELGPETVIDSLAEVDPVGPRKRVVVSQGELTVDATEQPPRRPMVVVTPQAEVMVAGARFAVQAVEDGTEVRVTSGAVRLRRWADRSPTDVPPGATLVATAADRSLQLPAAPVAADVRTLSAALGTTLDHPGGIG